MQGIEGTIEQQAVRPGPAVRPPAWRRTLLLVPLAGLVLLVGGLVLALTADEPPEVSVVASADAVVTAGASLVDAHNSPSLARSPRDAEVLVVADKVDRPRFSAALHASRDGGRTWAPLPFPTPAGEDRPYAPDLAWTDDGVLHLSFVTLAGPGNSPEAGWLSSSTDAGRTWTTPRKVLGGYVFQVRLAAAPSGDAVYLTWLQADQESTSGLLSFSRTGLPVMAMRSTDGGESFGEPVRVSPPDRLRVGAAVPEVLADGDLAVLYYDFGDDRRDFENLEGPVHEGTFSLVLARSSSELASFSESVVDDGVVPAERFLVYLPDFAGLAAGPEPDQLYVVWSDGRTGSRDVFLRRSTDGGRSWEPPVQVNPDSPQDQYLPAVAVAPDGRVDVVYLDRGQDEDNVMTAAAYAASADEGRTWTRVTLSTQLFPGDVGPGSETGQPDQGTRLAVLSGATGAVAAWTDARSGTLENGKLDVYTGSVSLRRERS